MFDEGDYTRLEDGDNYKDKFVIVSPDFFKADYREAKYQLFLAQGGFGCYPDKMGGKIFGKFFDEATHIRREYVLGVATEEAIQNWEKTYGMNRDMFYVEGEDHWFYAEGETN